MSFGTMEDFMRNKLIKLTVLILLITLLLSLATPVVSANDSLIRDFVERMYITTLERPPDREGWDFWSGHLRSGALTGAETAEHFVFSPEMNRRNLSNSAFLEIMYNAFFGRPSETEGRVFWLNHLNNGVQREIIFAEFVNSDEFTKICNRYGIIRGTYTIKEPIYKHDEIRQHLGVDYTIEPWEYAFSGWNRLWSNGGQIFRWQFLNLSEPLNLNRFPASGEYPFGIYGGLFRTKIGDVLVATQPDGKRYLYIDIGFSLERPGLSKYHMIEVNVDLNPQETLNYDQQRKTLPLWLSEGKFRNTNAVGTGVKTNKAFLNAIDNFWKQNQGNIKNAYEPAWFDTGKRYPIDAQLSDKFRDVISQAWKNESIAIVMPFNQAWFNEILSGVEFYFSVGDSKDRRGTGHYWSSPVKSQIALRFDWYEVFIYHLTPHELGHALGLCESLATLFAEELFGLHIPENLPVNMSLGGSLEGEHLFDRTFLRRMERKGRGNEFWAAAFHSNTEYGRLWDENMNDYIKFNDLQIIRGFYSVVEATNFGYVPELERSFRQLTSVSSEAAKKEILNNWKILQDNENKNANERNYAFHELQKLVNIINKLADEYNIGPFPAVLDHVIFNHNERYKNK